jgi:hypothetical protein
MKTEELTPSEVLVIKRALSDAIHQYERDLVMFTGTPIAEISRLSLKDAKSALKKIKGE